MDPEQDQLPIPVEDTLESAYGQHGVIVVNHGETTGTLGVRLLTRSLDPSRPSALSYSIEYNNITAIEESHLNPILANAIQSRVQQVSRLTDDQKPGYESEQRKLDDLSKYILGRYETKGWTEEDTHSKEYWDDLWASLDRGDKLPQLDKAD